jgi:hypothetical protein
MESIEIMCGFACRRVLYLVPFCANLPDTFSNLVAHPNCSSNNGVRSMEKGVRSAILRGTGRTAQALITHTTHLHLAPIQQLEQLPGSLLCMV